MGNNDSELACDDFSLILEAARSASLRSISGISIGLDLHT